MSHTLLGSDFDTASNILKNAENDYKSALEQAIAEAIATERMRCAELLRSKVGKRPTGKVSAISPGQRAVLLHALADEILQG